MVFFSIVPYGTKVAPRGDDGFRLRAPYILVALPHPERIHLIEHEGEASASIRRLAYEPFVGIVVAARSIVRKLCSLFPGNTPTCPDWHLLHDQIVSRNNFLKTLGNFVPVEHIYQNRQVGILKCFLQPR